MLQNFAPGTTKNLNAALGYCGTKVSESGDNVTIYARNLVAVNCSGGPSV